MRELKNAIARATVIADNNRISIDDLPERVREIGPISQSVEPVDGALQGDDLPNAEEIDLKAEMSRHEARLIVNALRRADWDRADAAKSLGLPVRTLAHKIQQYGIKRS